MAQWQYTRLIVGTKYSLQFDVKSSHYTFARCYYTELARAYEKLGSEGWELVNVTCWQDEEIHTFKKPILSVEKAPALEI